MPPTGKFWCKSEYGELDLVIILIKIITHSSITSLPDL